MPTLAFLGDVMLGRGVSDEVVRSAPESCWGTALPLLRSVDAVFANLECAITASTKPWSRTPKRFHFRAAPAAVEVLRTANIRYVSLANNHTLDYEVDGLLDTLRHLDAAGVAHAGAGRNLAEARAPAILDVAGLRIGIVSATDNEPDFAATRTSPGTNYERIGDPDPLSALRESATAARQAGAAFVALSLHWGPNMVAVPPRQFRGAAERSLEFANLVHGHSAHVFQGVERRAARFILYDTGDFVDDYAVDPWLRNDWSFAFLCDVTLAGVIERVRMIPVRLRYARVDLATGLEFQEVCDCMRARAALLGTSLAQTGDGLVLEAAAPAA